MKKYVCPVCGYVHEGRRHLPSSAPSAGVPGSASSLELMEEGTALKLCMCSTSIGGRRCKGSG